MRARHHRRRGAKSRAIDEFWVGVTWIEDTARSTGMAKGHSGRMGLPNGDRRGSWMPGQAISRTASSTEAGTAIRGVGLGGSSPRAPTIRVGGFPSGSSDARFDLPLGTWRGLVALPDRG